MANCKICGKPVVAANVFHSACWETEANKVAEEFCCLGCSVPELKEGQALHKEWEEAYQEGRLVVLPCAPDATYWEMHGNIPAVSRFDGMCTIDENLDVLFYKNEGDIVRATDIGKTVFLTREEAERALAQQ